MNNNILNHIKEYFNIFNHKDYTIYVDGTPTEWCNLHIDITLAEGRGLNNNFHRIVWDIPSDSNERSWYWVNVSDIETLRLTPTTMEVIKTNGKEYKLAAKPKSKEKKAKDIILRTENALYGNNLGDALDYLAELKALMNE